MCGIAGIAGPDRDDAALARMLDDLVHRGPDGLGTYADADVSLGNTRLAIIDLPGGGQPIFNEDRTVAVVLNGEIYNYVELREELLARGHTLATRSDTEVIVHLYEDFGVRLVDHLRGMFAFALWDTKCRQLLIARDRLGEKPLYYRTDSAGRSLSFASEINALSKHRPCTLDTAALRRFVAFGYVPTPGTIYREINALPPAHWMTWTPDGRVEIQRYWRISEQDPVTRSWDAWKAIVREKVTESIRLRLRADVPVGVFLSGGIDSAVITAVASQMLNGRLETFSIGFQDKRFNELPLASIAARRFGTNHHELVIQPEIDGVIYDIQRRYGQPFADSSAVAAFGVSGLAADHLKVVLTGDGGDEVFSGYRRYLAATYAASLPRVARSALGWISKRLPSTDSPRSRYGFFRRFATGAGNDLALSSRAWTGVFDDGAVGRLLTPDLVESPTAYLDLVRSWDDRPAGDLSERLRMIDCEHLMPDDLLVKMDIASMAYSLEARAPFLDHALFDEANHIPSDVKLRRGQTKSLLRESFADVLPAEILEAPKRGFEIPVASWLRGPLRSLVGDLLLSERTPLKPFLRHSAVSKLVVEHQSRHADRAMQLWTLLSLAVWLDTQRP